MSGDLVKARVAIVVIELEGEGLQEIAAAVSGLVSQAIVSGFRATTNEPDEPDDETPTGETKQ